MQAADLDEDGDDDITLGNSLSFQDELRLYENLLGKPLKFAERSLGFFEGRQYHVLVDLNGDGRLDVAMPEDNAADGNGVIWLENLAGLSFVEHRLLPYVDVNPRVPHVVDLGGDGNPDLVGIDFGGLDGVTVRVEARRTVGAWTHGLAPEAVLCRNRTTGRAVREGAPADRLVDCVALGLEVSPGDRVELQVRGTVE